MHFTMTFLVTKLSDLNLYCLEITLKLRENTEWVTAVFSPFPLPQQAVDDPFQHWLLDVLRLNTHTETYSTSTTERIRRLSQHSWLSETHKEKWKHWPPYLSNLYLTREVTSDHRRLYKDSLRCLERSSAVFTFTEWMNSGNLFSYFWMSLTSIAWQLIVVTCLLCRAVRRKQRWQTWRWLPSRLWC